MDIMVQGERGRQRVAVRRLVPIGIMVIACVLAAGVCATAGAQEAGDLELGPDAARLDDIASLEMSLMVEPPPDDAPYRPKAEPEARPSVPPAAPQDFFGKWLGFKGDLKKEYGTGFYLYLSFTPQYLVTGPNDGATRGVFWFNLNLTQDLWKDAQVISNVRGGTGRGMQPVINNILPTNWQQNEVDCVYISHLLLQQQLFDKKVTLSIGKLDLDDQFDTNEVGSWNFLSYALARNPSMPVPWHVLGGSARWDVADWLYVQAGTGDRNGEGGESGFDTTFGGDAEFFSVFELGIKPKLMGRPGTYRFLVWHDPADQARFDGGGSESGDTGFALSFDQQVNEKIGVFARYGYADGEVRALEHFWSAGATFTGLIPGRKDDVLGVAVAQGRISGDLRDVAPFESSETLFETYYKISLWPGASLTPDFQVILNPGAMDQDTAFIAGVNFVLIF